ncbi:hypothetical protein G3A56_00130 [Rhizobium oryzihabitans]|uniref:Restriction alleviation protein, Lar family n=1 Tax=Rhizobium oryzihabitans TaxID=2267833 RepID=A0A7L5BCL0_9HYPH|nr:Lar family restriction alleviation protein [Rhizobium oryzihabitans]QIB36604.1 hypothetical protein G3A56_00130 [Rhizobium oryzihabitans]
MSDHLILRFCPFCGGDEASAYMGEPGPGIIKCWAVNCGAEMAGFSTDEEAAAAWNKRTDPLTWRVWSDDSEEGMPVDEDVMVDVKDRDGHEWLNIRAGSHPWMHLGSANDIVAWRLVEPRP